MVETGRGTNNQRARNKLRGIVITTAPEMGPNPNPDLDPNPDPNTSPNPNLSNP